MDVNWPTLIDALPDGVAVSDRLGVVRYANPAFQELVADPVIVGKHFTVMYGPESTDTLTEIAAAVEDADRGTWRGMLLYRPIGASAPRLVSATFARIGGEDAWLAVIFHDQHGAEARAERLLLFDVLVQASPLAMGVMNDQGRQLLANPAYDAMIGMETVGRQGSAWLGDPDAGREIFRSIVGERRSWTGNIPFRRADGAMLPAHIQAFPILGLDKQLLVGTIVRDRSDEIATEAERLRLQEEIIAAQQAALHELSTPLLPIADGVVAMPLIGTIDSSRAQQVMETLLTGVAQERAQYVILDITGVRVVDTQVASALIHAAQAVKLLGSQVVLTGIGPEIAQTLVSLGVSFSGMVTRATLKDGIAYALRAVGQLG